MTRAGGDAAAPEHIRPDAQRLDLLSHDIRAAISDVIGGLRQIDHDGIDEASRLQLERVRTSGESLARLVEVAMDILSTGRIHQPAEKSNLHLRRMLGDLELRWSGRARAQGLSFALELGEGIPPVISTDRLGLERALGNLLSNALKYTEEGEVRLSVAMEGEETLCFTVTDTGPGFSEAALAHLYTVNGRPEGTGKPGSGLGLHIARTIAERIGGDIEVSNPGGGATVALRLPVRAWQPVEAVVANPDLPDLSSIRVLVAEDNETNQLIAAQMLETLGAEYEIARDGVEALNWLEREAFDIALIDIDMPRLSGLDVMRYIRTQTGALRDIPILAVTAFVLRANRNAIFDAGADRILAKPIMSIEDFGLAIAPLLGSARPERPSAEADGPKVDFDRSRLLHLLEIAGPEGGRELLDRLEKDLRNVGERLERALAPPDQAEMRAQSHVLISLAGAVGAERLQHHAEALNAAAHQADEEAMRRLATECARGLQSLIAHVAAERGALEGGRT